MSKLTMLAAALVLSTAALGDALAAPARPWVAVSGAYNGYAMDDVNDDIGSINDLFLSHVLDDVDGGFSFGAALGVDVDRFSAAIGYERLLGSSAATVNNMNFSYGLAADVFVARGAYLLARTGGTGIGVGLGAGVATASGEIGNEEPSPVFFPRVPESQGPDVGQAVILGPVVGVSGTSPYFEGFVQADTRLGERWSLAPSIGYRVAKIEGTWEGSEGSADGTTDFSGWLGRVAVRFALK